jgi:hypothetical protein
VTEAAVSKPAKPLLCMVTSGGSFLCPDRRLGHGQQDAPVASAATGEGNAGAQDCIRNAVLRIEGHMPMEYIQRTIEPVLRAAVTELPAVVLTGPRQSGKTTVLKHLFGQQYE